MKITGIIIALLLISSKANAGFNIGTSLLYIDAKDPDYKYIDSYKPKLNSVSIGYNKEVKRFNIGLSTNRLLVRDVKRKVSCSGQVCTNLTKVTHDSFHLGYRVGRYIPSIFVSNVNIVKSLYLNNNYLGVEENTIIAYGFGGSYLLNERINISINIIMPNKEIHMKKGLGLSINYNF